MDNQTFLLGIGSRVEAEHSEEHHRRFDPLKRPGTPAGLALVSHVVELVQTAEKRTRKRRAADQAVFEATISALVCDLASAVMAGKLEPTRLEFSKQSLSVGNRRAGFMTEKFPDTVRSLCHESVGLFELKVAHPGKYEKRQSTLQATDKFIELIVGMGIRPDAIKKFSEPVELRGRKAESWVRGQWIAKAPRMKWPSSEVANKIKEQMLTINDWLATADFDLFFDPERPVDLSNRSLKRIFNEESLELGGRAYGGFWQSMRASDRLECICLNDEHVVGLDFGQTSIRMAYAEVGVDPPEGDLYAIPSSMHRSSILWTDFRDEVKVVMNSLLASDEDVNRYPKGARGQIPRHISFDRLLDDIIRYHEPIAELFGTGRGLKTMKKESDVLIDVLLRLKDHRIHALPVHDGIYVAESHAGLAKEVMESSFLRIVGVPGSVTVEGFAGAA